MQVTIGTRPLNHRQPKTMTAALGLLGVVILAALIWTVMDGRDTNGTDVDRQPAASAHQNNTSVQSVTNANTSTGNVVVSDNIDTYALDWQRFTGLNASSASIAETNPSAWNRFVAENTVTTPAGLTYTRDWHRFAAENTDVTAKPNIATAFGIRHGIGITAR